MRKQIRNLPKILNFVKKIHYYSELFTSLLGRFTTRSRTSSPRASHTVRARGLAATLRPGRLAGRTGPRSRTRIPRLRTSPRPTRRDPKRRPSAAKTHRSTPTPAHQTCSPRNGTTGTAPGRRRTSARSARGGAATCRWRRPRLCAKGRSAGAARGSRGCAAGSSKARTPIRPAPSGDRPGQRRRRARLRIARGRVNLACYRGERPRYEALGGASYSAI